MVVTRNIFLSYKYFCLDVSGGATLHHARPGHRHEAQVCQHGQGEQDLTNIFLSTSSIYEGIIHRKKIKTFIKLGSTIVFGLQRL